MNRLTANLQALGTHLLTVLLIPWKTLKARPSVSTLNMKAEARLCLSACHQSHRLHDGDIYDLKMSGLDTDLCLLLYCTTRIRQYNICLPLFELQYRSLCVAEMGTRPRKKLIKARQQNDCKPYACVKWVNRKVRMSRVGAALRSSTS